MSIVTMKPVQRAKNKCSVIFRLVSFAFLSALLVVAINPFLRRIYRHLRDLRDLSHGPTPDHLHDWLIKTMANRLRNDESLIWSFQEDPARPAIYTFFEPLVMMEKDYELIAAWKHAWYQAGWNPHVLSLKDVQKHPNYATIHASVDKFGYDEYETMCYLRHFAMATNKEGGWMADFDAFPIYFDPNIYGKSPEKFISYGNGVPSLIGGTQQEWERVAQLMLLEGIEHHHGDTSQDKYPFSDMLALFKIRAKGLIDAKQETVDFAALDMGIDKEEKKPIDCDWLRQNARVIHGAHAGMRLAGFHIKLRASALADAMQRYHDVCNGPDFYTIAAIESYRETRPYESSVRRRV